MAHFYSGIRGQAGEATRMGSKRSGISGYVQSWEARLSVDMNHDHHRDIDHAHFRLGAGPTSGGGTLSLDFRDVSTVVQALGSGDPKIHKIRERIYKEIDKLNEEAEAAVKRSTRRKNIEAKRRERERLEKEKRMAELRSSITDDERKNYREVVLMLDADDLEAYPRFADDDYINDQICQPYGQMEPFRNKAGHLVHMTGDGFNYKSYNLTTGKPIVKMEEKAA